MASYERERRLRVSVIFSLVCQRVQLKLTYERIYLYFQTNFYNDKCDPKEYSYHQFDHELNDAKLYV